MIDQDKVKAFWDARAKTFGALDFNSIASNYGSTVPAPTILGTLVPEPSIGLLAGLGAVALRRRRRL